MNNENCKENVLENDDGEIVSKINSQYTGLVYVCIESIYKEICLKAKLYTEEIGNDFSKLTDHYLVVVEKAYKVYSPTESAFNGLFLDVYEALKEFGLTKDFYDYLNWSLPFLIASNIEAKIKDNMPDKWESFKQILKNKGLKPIWEIEDEIME